MISLREGKRREQETNAGTGLSTARALFSAPATRVGPLVPSGGEKPAPQPPPPPAAAARGCRRDPRFLARLPRRALLLLSLTDKQAVQPQGEGNSKATTVLL